MRLYLQNLDPSQIDFINAHGTGTENNDKVESIAMLRLFGKVPAFASTKANIGHTLGAAGAIEALYCILNLAEQELYPGINFKNPIPETGLEPIQVVSKNCIETYYVKLIWFWRQLFIIDLFQSLIPCFIFIKHPAFRRNKLSGMWI